MKKKLLWYASKIKSFDIFMFTFFKMSLPRFVLIQNDEIPKFVN